MEAVAGSPRTAMQRFGHGGMMLLPWTKQILAVVWEHFRLLLQVICYSLMAVFQMFRFEVHVRITDDAGEHIQHISSSSRDAPDGFLLSSLFENNKSGDPFDLDSHSRSVLSSLVNDELCCSLVDDFVSRATECLSDSEELYIGEPCSWKHSWNVLTGSEGAYKDDLCPVAFTACVSSLYQKDFQKQDDLLAGLERSLSSSSTDSSHRPCQQESGGQSSDSEVSWGGSDSSCVEVDKEDNDRLWDLLTKSTDPYHPLHFTACVSSAVTDQRRAQESSSTGQEKHMSSACQSSASLSSDTSEQGSTGTVSSEDEEDSLWKSLSLNDDPYHPLNFRAPLHSRAACSTHERNGNLDHAVGSPDNCKQSLKTSRDSADTTCKKPLLPTRRVVSHKCPQLSLEKPSKVPWKRLLKKTAESSTKKEILMVKRVKFSPIVQVHKMRAWSFALQASRKGPWEEHARDRDRFQRRILETEQAIGYCFSLSHRKKLAAYQQNTLTK
ncbi:protein phosphatase 1 regulatory subunit 15B [Colossoma macropomum]|uniref:protein phosphatase 1 regulatory subunit 15B n=1 Tax=Colossoma macropomum TaxID=42526 RepID=UPI001863D858|nr:protein phosphatase 1 regulatory subunit 15B [Colossoma macropomum]